MSTVLVPLARGFEEIEAIAIIDVLRRAGITVVTAAMASEKSVKGAHNIVVQADKTFAEVEKRTFDAVVLPGGPAAATLAKSKTLLEMLKVHADKGHVVGAICAAPAVLAKAGVLRGKNAACYPSVEPMVASEATVKRLTTVVDGNIVTSRGPSTAVDFALALVGEIAGQDKRSEVAAAMLLAP